MEHIHNIDISARGPGRVEILQRPPTPPAQPDDPILLWDFTDSIFGDWSEMFDGELISHGTDVDFTEIFARIERFTPASYRFGICMLAFGEDDHCRRCKDSSVHGLLREWEDKCCDRLQFWITENRWGVVFGDDQRFLVVGNNRGEPFVITEKYRSVQKDRGDWVGEYNEYGRLATDLPALDLEGLKLFIKHRVYAYTSI